MTIHQQSVFESWPIEDESVQAIIYSPPYFALRKYAIEDIIIGGDKDCKHEFRSYTFNQHNGRGDSQKSCKYSEQGIVPDMQLQAGFCIHCQSWKGQYGLEESPGSYVEHTRLWAKEAWRVLRNDGVFFLNLADSYHNPTKWTNKNGAQTIAKGNARDLATGRKQDCGIPSKCQLLIPHRVAIGLVEDGWVLRNTICWFKSNAMPESVTDRFSKKYEYIFMFTKQEKYYFNLDSVRETAKYLEVWSRKGSGKNTPYNKNNPRARYGLTKHELATQRKGSYQDPLHNNPYNPLGKNPGDVWQIPTQPSSEKHFAMWPECLVERMVKCSTKAGDTVLDPFAGSGTTLKVAEQLHRKGTGIDLGYHEISKRRTSRIQKELFV